MTLENCFQKALARSETIGIHDEEIRIAEAHYLQALGMVLPHLDVQASEFIQDVPGASAADGSVGSTLTRRTRPEVAVSLTHPLFQGFREFRALKISRTEKNRNSLDRKRAIQILFQDVARAYYTVMELEQERAIQNSIRETLARRIADLKNRISLGKSRASELLSTESEIAALEADIAKTKGFVLTSRDYLAFLVGETVEERLVDSFRLPGKVASLESYLEKSTTRPDIGANREAVRLAKGQVDYEKGARLPTVDFKANYYPVRVGFQSDIDWDLNFGMTLPIFHGGATRGKIREAQAELKQSELTRLQSTRQAELEIREAYHNFATARTREAALNRAESKAGASYLAQTGEYTLGLVNNLQVLQSLHNWQQRQLDANQSRFETKLHYLALLVASGEIPGLGEEATQ